KGRPHRFGGVAATGKQELPPWLLTHHCEQIAEGCPVGGLQQPLHALNMDYDSPMGRQRCPQCLCRRADLRALQSGVDVCFGELLRPEGETKRVRTEVAEAISGHNRLARSAVTSDECDTDARQGAGDLAHERWPLKVKDRAQL